MRKEITLWVEQAAEEFDTAELNYKHKKYFASAFFLQQSTEKYLKALFMYEKKKSPGTTHSLSFLGRELKVPQKYFKFLRDLSAEYFFSRYPDAIDDVPYKTYSKEIITDYIKVAKEVIAWVKAKLK